MMESPIDLRQVLILSNEFEAYRAFIEQEGFSELTIIATPDPQVAVEQGTTSEIVFGEPSRVRQVINQLKGVKWVQSSWAGVEPLMAPGLRRDYLLTNIRGVYGPLMAEYVFGYMLLIERKIIERWQLQQQFQWDARPHGTLQGKILGLLGVGTIGCQLARTAQQFGMQVYGYTRSSESCPDVDRYFHGNQLREFASDLDYLVSTLPGTPSTRGIIDTEFLSWLPEKTWLVSIGRGTNIDELALATALQTERVSGAVLDVFSQEPLPTDHPLWHTPNTFITAHTAAINDPPHIARVFIENYRLYLSGKNLKYKVDFEQGY